MASPALTPRLPAPFVLVGIPSTEDAADPTLLGSALLQGSGCGPPRAGREGSSPDLCSHHPPARVLHADRGNDFNVPVNKLSGCISLKRQSSELPSPPRRCLGEENQFQLCAHTHTPRVTGACDFPAF